MSKGKLSSPGYGIPGDGLIYYRRVWSAFRQVMHYSTLLVMHYSTLLYALVVAQRAFPQRYVGVKLCAAYLVQQVRQSDKAWIRFVGGGVPFAVPHPVDADFGLLDDETVRLEVAAGGCG
eukprot:2119078-Pleurochrysis_carterae.AAC.1